MSSSIGGIGSSGAMMMQGMRRPDPAQMANDLFAKLDSSGQGYIQKSDLQSAFDKISSSSSSSSTASNVDELFAKLDGDGNGKVTKEEFTDTLKKIADELDSQFANMRMNGGVQGGGKGGGMSGMSPGSMGGMPPPPPGGDSGGMTKAQLTSAANETSSSNSEASSSLSKLVNNFDEADTDGDGKISFMEAMKYEQKTSSTDPSTSSSSSSSSSSSDLNAHVMSQIMKLLQTYGAGDDQSSSLLSTLSVSA